MSRKVVKSGKFFFPALPPPPPPWLACVSGELSAIPLLSLLGHRCITSQSDKVAQLRAVQICLIKGSKKRNTTMECKHQLRNAAHQPVFLHLLSSPPFDPFLYHVPTKKLLGGRGARAPVPLCDGPDHGFSCNCGLGSKARSTTGHDLHNLRQVLRISRSTACDSCL